MLPKEFWELLSTLLKQYGLLAIVELAQAGLIVWMLRVHAHQEKEKAKLQDKLLELSEKRLEDAREEREDYEELARNLDKSINLLIKVFRKKSALTGDEG